MALIGDTVRLVVRFRTFNGEPVDPENVTLRILDGDSYEEVESILVPVDSKVNVGIYEYDYIVPEGESNTLVYEYSGTFNEKPILSRGSFNRAFI